LLSDFYSAQNYFFHQKITQRKAFASQMPIFREKSGFFALKNYTKKSICEANAIKVAKIPVFLSNVLSKKRDVPRKKAGSLR
jgi:hypothetical protein